MEILLHNVSKIEVQPVTKHDSFATREILIITSTGEVLQVDCFADNGDKLETTYAEVKE